MEDLDQVAIGKILGSRLKPIGRVDFGHFASVSATEEIQKTLRGDGRSVGPPSFTYHEDALIVRAFEEARDGASVDELLWNKDLAASFVERCRALGLEAPCAAFIRRLMIVRKHSARYREHGIVIRPTTKRASPPRIVPAYAHVIEFALVKLRYRYGSSIDEILMDRFLGDRFEDLVHQFAPSLSSRDVRLGALSIRRDRELRKKVLEKLNALDLAVIEGAWKGVVRLSDVRPDEVPVSPGLIEIKEEDRHLYVAHNSNIHSAVDQLRSGEAFRLMASSFWEPKLEAITLAFAPGQRVAGTSIETWERKLIHDRDPVFNWPVAHGRAD
jgi:hypothetical protein